MKSVKGFTLIELMVTVTIVGLLLSIALPSYTASVQKTARSEAVGHVIELASSLAKVNAITMSYLSADGETNHTDRYNIQVSLEGLGYVITAVPTQSQQEDVCGEILYYSSGLWEFANGYSYDDCVG